MAHLTFLKLYRWVRRRHSKGSLHQIVRQYWQPEKGKWQFTSAEATPLYHHAQTAIKRFTKVSGSKSPYDGDWLYWVKRRGQYPGVPKRIATLLKRQAGQCTRCGLFFHPDDHLEVDHIIPKAQGGQDAYPNWQLLHTHCHHAKTSQQRNLIPL
jgi:RNA-directed DNA polymerase